MKTSTGTNCIGYQPHANGRACHEDARSCLRAQACTSQTTTQYMSEFCSRDSCPRLGACNTSIFLTLHPNALRDVGYLGIHHATHSDSASEIFQGLMLPCLPLMTSRLLVSIRAATITILKQSVGLLITLVKCQPPSSGSASTEPSSVLFDIWFPASFSGPARDGWCYSSHACDTPHKIP